MRVASRVRRFALAAALVLLVSGSLAVGLAAARAGGSAAAAGGDGIAIPVPAAGDRGVYTLSDEAARPGPPLRAAKWLPSDAPLEFRWLDPRPMHLQDGSPRWALAARLGFPADVRGQDHAIHYMDTAGQPLATGFEPGPTTQRSRMVVVPGVVEEEWEAEERGRSLWFGAGGLPWRACALRHGFQGAQVPLHGTVVADLGCPALGAADGTVLVVEASGGAPGAREARLRVEPRGGEASLGWVTFREGVPYPVRVELPVLAHGATVRLQVWTLAGLDRGTEPLALDGPAGDPLPPVELAPRPQWTIDDRGVDHPFPLSEAFGVARDHPTYDGLRSFLASSPDAYVAWADSARARFDHTVVDRWEVVVTDGEAAIRFRAERERKPVAYGPYAVPGTETTSDHVTGLSDHALPLPWLAPSELPDRTPTAASLLARWEAVTGAPAGAGSAWGLHFAGEASYHAGRWTAEWDADPGQPLSPQRRAEMAWSLLRMDGEGRPVELREQAVRDDPFASSALAPVAPGGDLEPASVAGPARLGANPAEATAIGIGGVLAGLLYYAWPALKGGAMGLFSRVPEPELLRNPLRARLMAAIEAQPGIHHQALVRLAGAGNGAAEHHLDRLVAAGLAVRHRSTRYTCYFARSAADRRAMAAAPLLKSPVARAILEAAQRRPGVTPSSLARELGVAAATVHYHVGRLRAAGLLDAQREAGAVRLRAGPARGAVAAAAD